MKRLFAIAAAALAVALVASGCDTSPVAATVGSLQIKQTTLNAQLNALSGNPAYVAAAQNSGNNVTGESPGTWSSAWVAQVLTTKVYAAAASQYVTRHNKQPDEDTQAAARGLGEALSGDVWLSFPAFYRDQLAQLYADLAQVAPPPTDVATVKSVFEQYRADFFTQVCVRQEAFSVTGDNGAIDFPASLTAAHKAVSGGRLEGGTVNCYTQAELEAQPQAFVHAVKALAPGQAQPPERTAYGYSVLAVDSRQSGDFSPAVQAVLGLGVNNGRSFSIALARVLSQTRVRIDPQYGTWHPASNGGAPRVTPPTGPADALAAVTPTTFPGG